MVIADPGADLLRLVREVGEPPKGATAAQQREAALLRRRFGLALPPPFLAAVNVEAPVRVATAQDGPAIAAVKWRAFGASYRGGVLPDAFLDARGVVPPVSFWVGRAMVPPSRRHRLLVWGRSGTVAGYIDVGPVHLEDADPGEPESGEVYELYVDPLAQGSGGGSVLLAAAEDWLRSVGYQRAELSVLDSNARAKAFYVASGWTPSGRLIPVDLGVVAFTEARFARTL